MNGATCVKAENLLCYTSKTKDIKLSLQIVCVHNDEAKIKPKEKRDLSFRIDEIRSTPFGSESLSKDVGIHSLRCVVYY